MQNQLMKINIIIILNVLDAFVNNNQYDLDIFKERNGPSNIYDDKQLNILVNHENNVKNATSLNALFEN